MWRYSIHTPRFLTRFYCSAKVVEKNNLNLSSTSVENNDDTKKHRINFNELKYETKVPLNPVSDTIPDNTEEIVIESKTIQLLERLSLVDLNSKEAYKTLKDSIQFANKIINIDTTNIEPLYTVLEDQSLYLREDEVTEGNCKDDILKNATLTEEDYFVAPPGNIPLEQEEKKFE